MTDAPPAPETTSAAPAAEVTDRVVDIVALGGGATTRVELDVAVFGIEPNVAVLHQVVTAQLAAARRGTQSTKTRAEVAGGGKKPFKQKGTGRARAGSERAPQFTGGGVALGPKPRTYRQRTPKKMVALALRSALSDRAAEGKVKVVERWVWPSPAGAAAGGQQQSPAGAAAGGQQQSPAGSGGQQQSPAGVEDAPQTPSTRGAREALDLLEAPGKVLVVLSRDDEIAYKSFRNLDDVQILLAGELNAYDILINDWVIFTRDTLPGTAAVLAQPVALSPTGDSVASEPEVEEVAG